LDGNGPTVAVLAHGFGRIYPASNQDLADRILARDGCLVTEYVPGTLAKPSQFVARDRIQSGLSEATIVIETAVKGGTMHTAKFTTAQGRRLAALVPPAALSNIDAFQGNYRLLADGTAIPIHQPDDLAALIR
jgi:DNA processing protein